MLLRALFDAGPSIKRARVERVCGYRQFASLGKFSRGRWAARGRGSLMTPRTRLAIALRFAQHFEARLGGRFI